MEGIGEFWRLIAGMSVALIAVGCALGMYARYLAQNLAFLNRLEHEATRHHVDRVLECVEEPEPPPEKVIAGLIPPR